MYIDFYRVGDVANHAAIELDNLSLSRNKVFTNTKEISECLSQKMAEQNLENFDYDFLRLMRSTLILRDEFDPKEHSALKLVEAMKPIINRLELVAKDPEMVFSKKPDWVTDSMKFCTKLSGVAAALAPSFRECLAA